MPPRPSLHRLGGPRSLRGAGQRCLLPPTLRCHRKVCHWAEVLRDGTGQRRDFDTPAMLWQGLPAPPGPLLVLPRVAGELPPPALLPGTGWEQDGMGTVLNAPGGQR